MSEPIEMQFGILSWVGPGNVDALTGMGNYGGVWLIEKHCVV